MNYEIHQLHNNPELYTGMNGLAAVWEPFMLHDENAIEYGDMLLTVFPEFQFAMVEPQSGEVMARGLSIPLFWDGTLDGLPSGWSDTYVLGKKLHDEGGIPNTLSAIEITINPKWRGQGLSTEMIRSMRDIASDHGYNDLIAPVRPTLKSKYPDESIENYISWTTVPYSEEPFDPWIRVHWRLGAEILKSAPESMHIIGSVEEWERWTNATYPKSGWYIVPGALTRIYIDVENDRGDYFEPNVWMRHRIPEQRLDH